jgi:hypothetical protein
VYEVVVLDLKLRFFLFKKEHRELQCSVDFKLSLWHKYCFLVLGFLHVVRSEFPDDASELLVGPIFTIFTSEGGTHREFLNVVGKLASHIMQKPENQEIAPI